MTTNQEPECGTKGELKGFNMRRWFDPKVGVGELLTILAILGGGLLVWHSSGVQAAVLEKRMERIEEDSRRHEVVLGQITDRLQTIASNQGIVAAMLTEHLRTHPTKP